MNILTPLPFPMDKYYSFFLGGGIFLGPGKLSSFINLIVYGYWYMHSPSPSIYLTMLYSLRNFLRLPSTAQSLSLYLPDCTVQPEEFSKASKYSSVPLPLSLSLYLTMLCSLKNILRPPSAPQSHSLSLYLPDYAVQLREFSKASKYSSVPLPPSLSLST